MESNNQNKGNVIALICVGTTILALFGLALSANDDQYTSMHLLAMKEDEREKCREAYNDGVGMALFGSPEYLKLCEEEHEGFMEYFEKGQIHGERFPTLDDYEKAVKKYGEKHTAQAWEEMARSDPALQRKIEFLRKVGARGMNTVRDWQVAGYEIGRFGVDDDFIQLGIQRARRELRMCPLKLQGFNEGLMDGERANDEEERRKQRD